MKRNSWKKWANQDWMTHFQREKKKFFHLLFVEFLELVLLRFYLRMNTIEKEQLKRCGSKGTAEQKWINQDWMTSLHLNLFIFIQAVAWCQKIFFVIFVTKFLS